MLPRSLPRADLAKVVVAKLVDPASVRHSIGYTAHQAFVIVAEAPYVLSKPPVVEGKTLVWSGNFKSSDDGSTRWFRVRIDCPLPAK